MEKNIFFKISEGAAWTRHSIKKYHPHERGVVQGGGFSEIHPKLRNAVKNILATY